MKRIYEVPDHFEAEITIFTTKEGGRISSPLNGIRWDFEFAENNPKGVQYMIWPDFFDEHGDSLSQDIRLSGTLSARMHVVAEENIKSGHLDRIQEGVEFYCMEGAKKVAKGVVTKLTGMHDFRA